MHINTNLILSGVIIIAAIITHRLIIWSANKVTDKYSRSQLRKQYLKRYLGYVIYTVAAIAVILVWGLSDRTFWVALGSTFAVIGVALFASWSILSNMTASFILYFTFPFKIGDRIRIHDKDLPVTAVISDIKAFYTLLTTDEGEEITYPNNLLLQKGVSILRPESKSVFDVIQKSEDSDPTV
jgi:small-conductance mechanosensitive channel